MTQGRAAQPSRVLRSMFNIQVGCEPVNHKPMNPEPLHPENTTSLYASTRVALALTFIRYNIKGR